jgi:hypothetical protein
VSCTSRFSVRFKLLFLQKYTLRYRYENDVTISRWISYKKKSYVEHLFLVSKIIGFILFAFKFNDQCLHYASKLFYKCCRDSGFVAKNSVSSANIIMDKNWISLTLITPSEFKLIFSFRSFTKNKDSHEELGYTILRLIWKLFCDAYIILLFHSYSKSRSYYFSERNCLNVLPYLFYQSISKNL